VKITCPTCSAKYSISDEKVVSRLAKIRCRKCSSTIVIDGKVNPPQVSATAGDAGDAQEPDDAGSSGSEYSVDLGDGGQRTMPVSEIVDAYNSGQVTGETFVWADGFADWKPLSEVQEIVDALHSAADAGSPDSPEPAPSPWEAKPQAAPAPAPRAAARSTRGGSSDLFGRIERAGSEDDVATSAPDASSLGGTGARNESSVLFSLSALTSAATTSKPSTPSRASSASLSGVSGSSSRDDSGLIDLKALTAAAVKSDGGSTAGGIAGLGGGGFAPAPIAPLGSSPIVAPLGFGAPLGGGLVAGDLAVPQKSKTGLYIAIGLVVAAVIVAVAFILRPQPVPVVVAPPPAPMPAPTPTPTPTPTLAAAPPATGSAAEDDAPDAGAKKTAGGAVRRPSGGGGAKKPPSGGAAAPAGGNDTPAPAAPKPKSNNCGCAPVDLNCHMRCKTKG
jgi:predicted Zn finger-like uncharacterized protein